MRIVLCLGRSHDRTQVWGLRMIMSVTHRSAAGTTRGGRLIQWRWLGLIALTVCLFSWKTILTHQFSLLTGYEGANQVYAWDHFAARALQRGSLPLWDAFTHSGHSFPREMQTALFYPPKLILYYWPLNRQGLLSPGLFHYFVFLTHIAGAWFLFLL